MLVVTAMLWARLLVVLEGMHNDGMTLEFKNGDDLGLLWCLRLLSGLRYLYRLQ